MSFFKEVADKAKDFLAQQNANTGTQTTAPIVPVKKKLDTKKVVLVSVAVIGLGALGFVAFKKFIKK